MFASGTGPSHKRTSGRWLAQASARLNLLILSHTPIRRRGTTRAYSLENSPPGGGHGRPAAQTVLRTVRRRRRLITCPTPAPAPSQHITCGPALPVSAVARCHLAPRLGPAAQSIFIGRGAAAGGHGHSSEDALGQAATEPVAVASGSVSTGLALLFSALPVSYLFVARPAGR